MTNADSILDSLEKAFTYHHKSYDASAGTAKLEAKAQLHKDIIELIGEDVDPGETTVTWDGGGGVKAENADTLRLAWENRLRAELREKINKYFGESE